MKRKRSRKKNEKFLGIVFLVILSQGIYAQEQSWEYPFIKALNYEERQEWNLAIEELERVGLCKKRISLS